MYLIGRINSTFGIKGELKLKNLSDFDRFYKGAIVLLKDGTKLEVENVRSGKNFDIIKFKNYNDIDTSRQIANNDLYTDQEPYLEENEYTYKHIKNLKVFDQNNNLIGKVIDVLFLPNQEVLKILTNDDKKIMIPFVSNFILEVDNEKIIVKIIEGILWFLIL